MDERNGCDITKDGTAKPKGNQQTQKLCSETKKKQLLKKTTENKRLKNGKVSWLKKRDNLVSEITHEKFI